MSNVIKEIDSIDEEFQRFRERQKMKIEKIFDDLVWEILAVRGYKGARSKKSALHELRKLFEQLSSEDDDATDEQEQESAPAEVEKEADSAPAPSPVSVY
ncbi:hypothetical protein [uncultured Mobiluncus sp.]|uniref:hypothetical protein n=1 Tax=uncultured Mobiluncus sp. TaxID=293425 RepID=UPI0026035452|nr:hypothetical protein [uncultured Mobiluncus sp.]